MYSIHEHCDAPIEAKGQVLKATAGARELVQSKNCERGHFILHRCAFQSQMLCRTVLCRKMPLFTKKGRIELESQGLRRARSENLHAGAPSRPWFVLGGVGS